MARARCLAVCAVLLAAVFVPRTGGAQIVYGDDHSGKLRFIVTSWTAEDPEETKMSQVLVPFFGYVPLGEDTEGRIYLAQAWNTLESEGRTDKLDGLTDARFQVNRSFKEDRFLASLGVSLPTGKTGLDLEGDLRVMSFLAQDYVLYPNRRLGEGLGLNGLVGAAATLGEYRLGGSLSLHYSGSYEAFAGQGDYKPGNYARLYGGVQRPSGPWDFLAGLSVSVYGDDQVAGTSTYNRGDQFEVHLGGRYRQPDFVAGMNLRTFLRGSSKVFDLTGLAPSQVQLYGDEVSISASCSWFLRGRTIEVGPVVDMRFIGANEQGLGKAQNLGGGVQSFYQVAGMVKLGLSLQLYTGEADSGAIDLSGYQVATSVSGTF